MADNTADEPTDLEDEDELEGWILAATTSSDSLLDNPPIDHRTELPVE